MTFLAGHHLYMNLCLSVCPKNPAFLCPPLLFSLSPLIPFSVPLLSYSVPPPPGYWDIGTLGHRTLRHLETGTPGPRTPGPRTLGPRDTGTLGHWGPGTLGPRDTGTPGHWDPGTQGRWDTRTMGHRENGWGWGAHLPQPCTMYNVLSIFIALERALPLQPLLVAFPV